MNQTTRAATQEQIAKAEAAKSKEAIAEKPKPKFAGANAGDREIVVPLEFPVEYDGITYMEIRIRRPVIREWANYNRACAEAVQQDGPDAEDQVDVPWMSAPAVVLNALDFLDGARVEAAQADFFAQASSSNEEAQTESSQQE